MTLAEGHRLEATQSLRKVLARAIEWELLDVTVAKVGVDSAGLSIFDLSRHMGTGLSMINRHYGHLARDNHQHAVALLDPCHAAVDTGGRSVDTRATTRTRSRNAKTRQ